MWCIGRITGEYLARMEDVLSLYNAPYDEKRPVVCLDELPFQLLGEQVEPLLMKPGVVKKIDYEYERKGVASVFVAFEPLTGKRLVRVYRQRTRADYCRFQQEVSNCLVPECDGVKCTTQIINKSLWDKFYTAAPARLRHFAEQYKIVKKA